MKRAKKKMHWKFKNQIVKWLKTFQLPTLRDSENVKQHTITVKKWVRWFMK